MCTQVKFSFKNIVLLKNRGFPIEKPIRKEILSIKIQAEPFKIVLDRQKIRVIKHKNQMTFSYDCTKIKLNVFWKQNLWPQMLQTNNLVNWKCLDHDGQQILNLCEPYDEPMV